MLLVALLTVSAVNATDITTNDNMADSVVDESSISTLSIGSDNGGSVNGGAISEDTKTDSVVDSTNSVNDVSDVGAGSGADVGSVVDVSDVGADSGADSGADVGSVDDNVDEDSNADTTKSYKSAKAVKSSVNDNDVLFESSPVIVDVYNAAQLQGLFSGIDSPGMASENLVINLLGDDDYVLTKNKAISRSGYTPTYFKLKNLTINGNNKVIDGDGKYSFIYFDFDERFDMINVTLNNLTIKNCTSNNGGAIYAYDVNKPRLSMTINGCVFDRNSGNASVHSEAGAIRFRGVSLTIADSNFTNNTATANNYADGGAIYSGSGITVINSRFEDNFATHNGGAIAVNGYAVINNTVFINNTASSTNNMGTFGGAIYQTDSTIWIENSNFTENSVRSSNTIQAFGGAVYVQKVAIIINSSFDNNSAINTNAARPDYGQGGALYIGNGKSVINSSNFTSNEAYLGGAIYVENELDVDGSNFMENSAYQGGVLFTYVKNTGTPTLYVVNITNSNLTSNHATSAGGAILTQTYLSLSGSNITGNNASTGGAIYIYNYYGNLDVNITDNTFRDNLATSTSGWVVFLNKGTTIENNLFVNNTDGTRDMLFNVLGKHVNNNVYIDNYLNDTWENVAEPIKMTVNEGEEIHLVNLRNVYNNTIVNGTILCYLEGSDEPVGSFDVTDGNATLTFDDSKLSIGLNNVRLRYVSLSRHYQNLERTLQIILKAGPLNITVKKVWDDNNNPNRPDGVTIVLRNDTGIVSTAVLNEGNEWTHRFENLPRYTDGDAIINYTIVESNVPEGYVAIVTNNTDSNFTVTNVERITVNVTKVWDDNNNQDGLRPDGVTVHLTANGDVIETVVLNANNGWKYSFDLPKFKDGTLINYNFTEESIDNYTCSVSNDGYSFNVTNTHSPALVEINVYKVWNDASNNDGLRTKNVTVHLTADGVEIGSAVLNASNIWRHSFNVPKFRDGGVLIKYNFTEDSVDGYTYSVSRYDYDFTVTNTHIKERVTINVSKVWNDYDDNDGLRPDSVTVHLTADGVVKETVVLSSANGWKASFNNLLKFKDGVLIKYNFTEDSVDGYTCSVSNESYSFNVTNTHIPELITINVYKFWDDSSNNDGLKPDGVTVHLTADGVVKDTVVLNEGNYWRHSFEVPKFKDGGVPIKYNFTEDSVSGYTYSVSNDADGFIVTNTHIPERITINVSKVWNDYNNHDGLRPASVTVHLTADGVVKETVVLSSANGWKASFNNLLKFKDGVLIKYNFTEDSVDNYTCSVSNNSYNFTVANTHDVAISLNVSTVWNDNNNQDGIRPKSVTVKLTADGKVVATAILNEANNWKASFNNLPMYKDGNLIKYNFTEDVSGYTSVTSNSGNNFVVTNKHVPQTVDVNVSIKWNDSNDNDGIRPDYVKLQLYANGVAVGNPVKAYNKKGSSMDQYVFTDLPKYKNGNLIDYSVREAVPCGYSESMSKGSGTIKITNTHKPEKVDYDVDIVWEGSGARPSTVSLQLYANGVAQGKPIVLSTKTNQKYIFDNLPKYKNGKLIKYTASLVNLPEGYKVSETKGSYAMKIKIEGTAKHIKWAWKLVRVANDPDDHKNGTHENGQKGHDGESKNLDTANVTYKSTNGGKSVGYKSAWKHYKHKYSYNKKTSYKYRLYIYLYPEYMNGSMSYDDFVAVLKAHNITITKADWKNGVIVIEFDDLDDVPDMITLHNKKGTVPDSSCKVNKTKTPDKDNVIDAGEVDTSKSNRGDSGSNSVSSAKSNVKNSSSSKATAGSKDTADSGSTKVDSAGSKDTVNSGSSNLDSAGSNSADSGSDDVADSKSKDTKNSGSENGGSAKSKTSNTLTDSSNIEGNTE